MTGALPTAGARRERPRRRRAAKQRDERAASYSEHSSFPAARRNPGAVIMA
jgi:hypothetical protein